jgi:hypothetical protein
MKFNKWLQYLIYLLTKCSLTACVNCYVKSLTIKKIINIFYNVQKKFLNGVDTVVANKYVLFINMLIFTFKLIHHSWPNNRFGDNAGEATEHVFATAGHAANTAWNVFKIRKAINPASSASKGVLKNAVKNTKF